MAAAVAKGSVAYKKKEGTLTLMPGKNGGTGEVVWTPLPGVTGAGLTIPIASITNLQATPATSANCMMKIFQTAPTEGQPALEYKLSFTSATNARGELEDLKKALTTAIQASKNTPAGGATPVAGGGTAAAGSGAGTPAALAIASALGTATGGNPPSGPRSDIWSDSRLVADGELQQELLKNSPDLGRTFLETVLKGSVTAPQFWSTRIPLLRAFAIERSQSRGAYNVLSTMKPKTVDNAVRISLSREQIQDIFRQHPLVKKVYDENVPKISEGDFWRRFFSSRLFKKLKGEKILPVDLYDDIVDAYLNVVDEASTRKKQRTEYLPNFINLEANEQHASQKQGNRPDMTMRPEKIENIPLIRTLNNISMKIVDSVTPIDAAFNEDRAIDELTLADLRGDDEVEKIILNISDQQRFFAEQNAVAKSPNISVTKNPAKVLKRLRANLGTGALDLAEAAKRISSGGGGGVSDEDGGDAGQKKPHAPTANAMRQITQAILERRNHLYDTTTSSTTASDTAAITPPTTTIIAPEVDLINDIPRPIHDALTLTHATTTEFLHHFWLAFLSGDPSRAVDLQSLVASLKRSAERVEAVAKQADEEKEKERERRRQQALAEYKATGRKRKKGADDNIPGGRKLVEEVLGPMLSAVDFAVRKWEEAVRDVEKEAAVAGGGKVGVGGVGVGVGMAAGMEGSQTPA